MCSCTHKQTVEDNSEGGTGGRETRRKGGGRCTGGGRRGGGKRDSQGGGKRENKGKIMQHCTMFCNRKNAKGREPKNTGREPGLKGTGSGRFKPPLSPPPIIQWSHQQYCKLTAVRATVSCVSDRKFKHCWKAQLA